MSQPAPRMEPARPIAAPASTGPGHAPPSKRSSPASAFIRWTFFAVLLPTALAGAYYGTIASDIFIAEARFAVRSASSATLVPGVLGSVLGTSGHGGASDDTDIVHDYILSRDMLEQLDERMALQAHYQSAAVDWLARLAADASAEDYLEYYRDMVTVRIDRQSNITTVEARAFDPRTAQDLAKNLLQLSEALVNQISATVADDALKFARSELRTAEERVRAATVELASFRSKSRLVDPGQETSAVLRLVTEIEGQLAAARAELAQTQTFMRSNSALVRNLTARVVALQAQVEQERARLSSEEGTDLTNIIYGYGPLALEQKLAEQLYTSALTSLEVARADAQRKQRYLIAFIAPKLPVEALEPDRAHNTLLVFLGSFLGFGIGALIWSAIKDHTRF